MAGIIQAKQQFQEYFRHSNDIERMFKQSDLVCDIEDAVSELIELIKTTDENHYQELKKALKK